jgi:NAD(P)-dependent dehydrogenase (short-subunit alcohol dehydrogenase family)
MEFQNSLFSLSGTKQLVVGGSRGLGLELALHLKSVGADLLVIGRSKNPESESIKSVYRSCDMGDLASLRQIVDKFVGDSLLGGVSMVAGVSYSSLDIPDPGNRFLKTIESNVILPYMCMNLVKDFLGLGSSVLFFSSINAELGFPGNPGYVTSKAGMSGLTRALATDWANDGIRVNSLQLGYFHTQMTNQSFIDPKKFKQRQERSLLNRWGKTDEILGPAQFLLSGASSFITGQAITVDGGWVVKGL